MQVGGPGGGQGEHVEASMNVQAAFEHCRKESALVGEEIRRLLTPKEDGSRSDEEDLRRPQEFQTLLERQNEAARMLLSLNAKIPGGGNC